MKQERDFSYGTDSEYLSFYQSMEERQAVRTGITVAAVFVSALIQSYALQVFLCGRPVSYPVDLPAWPCLVERLGGLERGLIFPCRSP